jgi:hypothetical protein
VSGQLSVDASPDGVVLVVTDGTGRYEMTLSPDDVRSLAAAIASAADALPKARGLIVAGGE